MRVIETGSLTLEPQTAAHAEEMFAVLSDPAIYEYENQPPPSLEWLRTRFTKLESRLSANGREQWLNWVIRLPTSELIGYVQAMISELVGHYRVRSLSSVLKRENLRSMHLLERLGFSPASPEQHVEHRVEPGELLMLRGIERI